MAVSGGAASAIIAKARAIYGKRLTPEDYNNLVHEAGVAVSRTNAFKRRF